MPEWSTSRDSWSWRSSVGLEGTAECLDTIWTRLPVLLHLPVFGSFYTHSIRLILLSREYILSFTVLDSLVSYIDIVRKFTVRKRSQKVMWSKSRYWEWEPKSRIRCSFSWSRTILINASVWSPLCGTPRKKTASVDWKTLFSTSRSLRDAFISACLKQGWLIVVRQFGY